MIKTQKEADIKQRVRSSYGENRQVDSVPEGAPCACCDNGTFIGKNHEGIAAFRGIPFAKAPVGELRWKRPEAPAPAGGFFEAYYNGRSPIQSEWRTEAASYYPQGEDCLYLNLWMNTEDDSTDKTVMVFFHGGAYGWGGTADPLYDGENFVRAQKDIILVTAAYRTGLMGFVDFSIVPGGDAFPDAPNLGILDQIEALRWVQRNIRAFGGNPDNVTVFGESAGGGSVSLLPVIDEAKGLFRRIIAQSGSVTLSSSKKECEDFTKRFMKAARASKMDDLLALSEEDLKEVNEEINYYNNFPQRDGRLIPEDPFVPYSEGRTADVDILVGTNKDETNYWIGESGGLLLFILGGSIKFENNLMSLSPKDLARVRHFLKSRPGPKVWKISEFYTELMFRVPAMKQVEEHAKNGGKAYLYYWTEPSALPHYGACHAVELAYVFGNLDETIYTGTRGNEALARLVQGFWADFARTGKPGNEVFDWPCYTPESKKTMVLNSTDPGIHPPVKESQRKFLEPLLDYWIDPTNTQLSMNVPFVRKLIGGCVTVLGMMAWLAYKTRK